MPRHQVTAPVTTAFRVANPDILRQILLYATTSTLAACVRVSQNCYYVAAPILYQDVEFHSERLHFLEGVHVISDGVSTRSAPRIANLKIPLLHHIKTMTVNYDKHKPLWHHNAFSIFPLDTLPRIETMRVKFHGLHFSTLCQCYDCNTLDRLPLALLRRSSVNKLVLLPSPHLCRMLYAWRLPLATAEILTVILPSDGLDMSLGKALATVARSFAFKLRLIISSWPDTEWCEVEQSEDGEEEPIYIASEDSIMAWILNATKGSLKPIEVYVVERPWKRSHAPQQPVIPLKVRAAALFDAFEAEEEGSMERAEARVLFKDRKDYLMEGITDEVDGEELARWKRAQDWEDQASFYEQYDSVILDERREEYNHHTNHPETIQEAQLVEEFQTDPDILLQDWEDRCVRAEELAEWIVETQDWEDQANFHGQYRSVTIYKQGSELDYRTDHPDAIPEAQLIEEYQTYPDIPLRHWEQKCVPAEELAEWIVETQDWEDQADFYNQDRAVTVCQQGVEHDDRIDHPDIIPDAQLFKAYQSYLDILLEDWEQCGVQAEELAEWIDEAHIWEDQVDFYDQYHPVVFNQPREQVDYYTNHPDTIPVAQLIVEYQIEANNLFLAEEQRHVAAADLAEWIDEGVTMTLVQELIYRHHFDNLFHPFRKARESSTIITNERNMLPTSEPTAEERSMDPCSTGRSDCR